MLAITDGDRYAVVTDATGTHTSMSDALRYVAHSGTLVYVGVTRNEIVFAHPTLHRPEMTLKASRNALGEDFVQIIRLIEDGVIDADPWITHRVGFERLCQEMDNLIQPGSNVLKAIIELR
jgi:threonine dehydrogenase-like Zn-dependent dehydrogenase